MSDARKKADAAVAVGKRLFSVSDRGDLNELREVFTPDVEIWHNTDESIIGVEQTIKNLHRIRSTAAVFEYRDLRVDPTPSGFVEQHLLYVKMPDGREVFDRVASVARVENGRIARFDAYHDSAASLRPKGVSEQEWRTKA
jgi:ketosteroid isomerase-like protein